MEGAAARQAAIAGRRRETLYFGGAATVEIVIGQSIL
jgi:hypothetical protein